MSECFDEFKAVVSRRGNQDQSTLSDLNTEFFPDEEWTPKALFGLLLQNCIYQALLCGTDRILLSDHQSFSAFFKYKLVDNKMTIDYYVINNLETVDHGNTLRSAIAGFFYNTDADANAMKRKLLL